jgi:hypothetical protein
MHAELYTLYVFLCILNVSSFIIVFSYWKFSFPPCMYITPCCCVSFIIIIINMTISISCKKIYGKINNMNVNKFGNVWWEIQIMKFLIIQFPSPSCFCNHLSFTTWKTSHHAPHTFHYTATLGIYSATPHTPLYPSQQVLDRCYCSLLTH